MGQVDLDLGHGSDTVTEHRGQNPRDLSFLESRCWLTCILQGHLTVKFFLEGAVIGSGDTPEASGTAPFLSALTVLKA